MGRRYAHTSPRIIPQQARLTFDAGNLWLDQFCIQFSNLSAFSPVALSVVSGLKRVLDCSEHLDLPPSAMDVFLDEDPPTSHLVGAAFADVVLSVVNSKVGIRKLPYLEQRCWLECLLILVYKVRSLQPRTTRRLPRARLILFAWVPSARL